MQRFLQDISIGENLKSLRERAGYSQAQLVAQLHLMGSNMSRSTYSKISSYIIKPPKISSVDSNNYLSGGTLAS